MYNYQEQKSFLFTDEGQRTFLKMRDKVKMLLTSAGCVRMGEVINGFTGDSWEHLACVDRMVELGELREIAQANVVGQHRIFVEV